MRNLLNEFTLPDFIYVGDKKLRPTDLTSWGVVNWLRNNLAFANRNHPKLQLALRKLDRML